VANVNAHNSIRYSKCLCSELSICECGDTDKSWIIRNIKTLRIRIGEKYSVQITLLIKSKRVKINMDDFINILYAANRLHIILMFPTS
jgi:hypothetical protein